MASEEARAMLRDAMALHSADDIDGALAVAGRAVTADPAYADAHAYIGNTLVTRRRRFADGLAALEQAATLQPDDAAVLYTLGWCREFVAHALERPRGPHQAVDADAPSLYDAAREALLGALALDPEPGLRADIRDMLDVVAAATGEPWEDA